jgi:hypothetical protein
LFGDPETRAFYEDLPDLLSLVPLSILGLTHEQAEALKAEWAAKEQAMKTEEENSQAVPSEEQLSTLEQETGAPEEATSAVVAGGSTSVDEGDQILSETIEGSETTADKSSTEPVEGMDETKMNKLNQLLNERLLECINKKLTDEFIVSFCYASNNNKNSRKRLIQSIAKLPRSRPELAPNYSRIIASLSRLYPDLVTPLVDILRKEFYFILKQRKQLHIDNKIKNVRFICELIKFRVIPPIMILKMFKSLLMDMTPHHIEMLAVGLETCGRFLYLLPYTRESMEKTLEMMIRLRNAKNLDLYQQTLIDSAYFVVKPPENASLRMKKVKERGELEQYIRYLVIEKLDLNDSSLSTVDAIIKASRRLPWTTKEAKVEEYFLKAALKLARTKYITIPNLADCLSGLSRYYPNLIIAIIDNCLEEIQRSLEIPYKREIQRILGYSRLVGELYNFTAIPSTIIFDLLYHLIHYGHCHWYRFIQDCGQYPALKTSMPAFLFQSLTENVFLGSNNSSSTQQPTTPSTPIANQTPQTTLGGGIASFQGQQQANQTGNVQHQHLPPFIPSGLTNCPIPINYFDPRILCEIDLPTDLFRSQIICEILNTCGVYYVRGVLKEKLQRFLVYFQRYLLTKQLIPLHIEFQILDTFDHLEELAREAYLETVPSSSTASGKNAKKGKTGKLFPFGPSAATADVVVPVAFPRYDNYENVQKIIDGFEATLINRNKDEASNNANIASSVSGGGVPEVDEEEERMIEEHRLANREEEDLKEERKEKISKTGKKTTTATTKKGEEDQSFEEEKGDRETEGAEEEEEEEDEDDSEDSSDSDSDSDSDDDDDEDDSTKEPNENDLLLDDEEDEEDEAESAARLMEKMRIVQEDEEFEKQFKAVMQVKF